MINGSFGIVRINRKCLFLSREEDNLLDIPGGGVESNEVDYTGVFKRELLEETGLDISRDQIMIVALLGQRLKKVEAEKYGVEFGHVFVHTVNLYGEYDIKLSHEHTDYQLLTYDQVLENYKRFKSGPLWMFFAFLAYQDTGKLQEGMLYDRRIWQGKEYI